MRIVFDIETDRLVNPSKIWVIVCKDIDSGEYHIFREVTEKENERERFINFLKGSERTDQGSLKTAHLLIGHNSLGFDCPVLHSLLGLDPKEFPILRSLALHAPHTLSGCLDTLIISKLVDYTRGGKKHSIEAYGEEFGFPKIKFTDFTHYSQEMEDYCVRDVDITERVFNLYRSVVYSNDWIPSLVLEHNFQSVVNSLHNSGFSFNGTAARNLHSKVLHNLGKLDKEIQDAFPPRLKLVRVVEPTLTQHGTLHRKDFRWVADGDLTIFNGGPFCRCVEQQFNPASHRQIVQVLAHAGWMPIDKTDTHKDVERELQHLKYTKNKTEEVDLAIQLCNNKLQLLKQFGWKINENNLATLPSSAPKPARLLAKRILLESRRRSLTEWLGLVQEDSRIHGDFLGIGAWTHRMAHQKPNTANIPNDKREDGSIKLLGKELRSLWQAPPNRLLVGVDAEGIQLRIFAHYINDEEFTNALVKGKKSDKTDPHSLNQRVIGSVCKSRQAAKRFIYALLLGGGINKLAFILDCSVEEAGEALDRILERYTGFALLKKTLIPKDGKRGYFIGLDGRRVPLPGSTPSERSHLCMSGYLQNGEAIIMKRATLKWFDQLKDYDAKLVNFVHDEWQVECPNDMTIALQLAQIMSSSLTEVGEDLKLKCPLAGSYWNDDHKEYTIGLNWFSTH